MAQPPSLALPSSSSLALQNTPLSSHLKQAETIALIVFAIIVLLAFTALALLGNDSSMGSFKIAGLLHQITDISSWIILGAGATLSTVIIWKIFYQRNQKPPNKLEENAPEKAPLSATSSSPKEVVAKAKSIKDFPNELSSPKKDQPEVLPLLLFETSDVAAAPSGEAVCQLGFTPIFLYTFSWYHGDTKQQIESFTHFPLKAPTLSEIRNQLSSGGIDKAVGALSTLNEISLENSYVVAKELGGETIDPAIININDKTKLYELIPDYCPDSIIFDKRSFSFERLLLFLKSHQSIILKPAKGYASEGVRIIESEQDLSKWCAEFALSSERETNEKIIAQQFEHGELIMLDGFVSNGQITFLGFASEKKIENTATVFEFPADNHLSEFHRNRAYEAIQAIIKRFHCKDSYFHVQFIVSENSIKVIDPNFGRIGGGGFGHVISCAYGISPVELYKHIIDINLFKGKHFSSSPFKNTPTKSAGIHYAVKNNSRLHKIDLPSSLGNCTHTQVIGDGEKVPPLGTSNLAWVGILVGPSDEVFQKISEITLELDEGTQLPCY